MPEARSTSLKIIVSEPAGPVSAELCEPPASRAMVTLAHGAGTNMHHAFLANLSAALATHDIATLRFNFSYTEKGRKMPDRFPVASMVVRSVLEKAHSIRPDLPLFCSGKSFGGRMSSMTMAHDQLPFVRGVMFYGFPLHPANRPSTDRAQHLGEVRVPMFFLQGSKDTLAYTDLITSVCAGLPSATLEIINGADHSFNNGRHGMTDLLAQRTAHWISTVLG
jgi:uncharacterized protein